MITIDEDKLAKIAYIGYFKKYLTTNRTMLNVVGWENLDPLIQSCWVESVKAVLKELQGEIQDNLPANRW